MNRRQRRKRRTETGGGRRGTHHPVSVPSVSSCEPVEEAHATRGPASASPCVIRGPVPEEIGASHQAREGHRGARPEQEAKEETEEEDRLSVSSVDSCSSRGPVRKAAWRCRIPSHPCSSSNPIRAGPGTAFKPRHPVPALRHCPPTPSALERTHALTVPPSPPHGTPPPTPPRGVARCRIADRIG